MTRKRKTEGAAGALIQIAQQGLALWYALHQAGQHDLADEVLVKGVTALGGRAYPGESVATDEKGEPISPEVAQEEYLEVARRGVAALKGSGSPHSRILERITEEIESAEPKEEQTNP